ncbi:MAG: CGGC domain-containing protein [Veillonella parvula]
MCLKKIAVLVNEETMQRCSCGGCLKAFMNKADSFERYADEDIELVGFTHSGGDLAKKIESFKKKGVTAVHLSTCTRGKNENYESIAEQCAEAGFDVVGYTHGSAVSKDGKEAVVLSAKPVTTDQ